MARLESLRIQRERGKAAAKAGPAKMAKASSTKPVASRGVQRQRVAEQKRRHEAAAVARQEAEALLVAERLQAQRILDRVRRPTGAYPPQMLRSWWFNIAHEDRPLIEAELVRRDKIRVDATDRQAAIDRQVRCEIDKSIQLWGRDQTRRASEGIVDERLVPGHGLKPITFFQVPPDYLDRRAERFWPYVDTSRGADTCWPWHGPERFESGYGHVSWQGHLTPAHRVAWTLEWGLDLPYDLVVDHLCQCKWCVNPDHLEPVTRGENNRRTRSRRPEDTRTRTSFESPFVDRWYPFGRRLYDEDGNRRVVEEEETPIVPAVPPPKPWAQPRPSLPIRRPNWP